MLQIHHCPPKMFSTCLVDGTSFLQPLMLQTWVIPKSCISLPLLPQPSPVDSAFSKALRDILACVHHMPVVPSPMALLPQHPPTAHLFHHLKGQFLRKPSSICKSEEHSLGCCGTLLVPYKIAFVTLHHVSQLHLYMSYHPAPLDCKLSEGRNLVFLALCQALALVFYHYILHGSEE